MHPQITSQNPGICPICHMKLIKKENTNANPKTKGESHKIQISREKQNWIGVQTTKIVFRKIQKTLRFPGSVAYEPELFAALSEYAESLKQKGNSELFHNSDLSSISYNRLLQLGLSREGIQFLLPRRNELVTGGKNSAIVVAQIYEGEIANISSTSIVKLYSSSYPSLVFVGKIQALDGILNSETRTLRAWILANNPSNFLKSQMLVEIEIQTELKEVLSIPSDSIIHIGKRNIVYKKVSETEFIPQEILIGIESENYTEVLQGLSVNDEIVTHGVFLIDSESKIHLGSEE